MPSPTILVEQSGQPPGVAGQSRDDLVLSSLVTLSDPANPAATSFSWTLTTPVGSSAALSDPTASSPTFTPDVEGTYLAYLEVDGLKSWEENAIGDLVSTQGGGGVKLTNATRIPGSGETKQFDATIGWQEALDPVLRSVDSVLAIQGQAHGSIFYANSVGDVAALAPGGAAFGSALTTGGAGTNPSWDDRLVMSDHSAATPSYGFNSNPGYGMYKSGTSIRFAVAATEVIEVNAGAFELVFTGSEGFPAIVNQADPNTGIWWTNPDIISIATGGSQAIAWNASQQTLIDDGLLTAPGLAFASAAGSGISRSAGTQTIVVSGAAGGRLLTLDEQNWQILAADTGSASVAIFTRFGDGDTGAFFPGTNIFGVTAGGTEIQRWATTGTAITQAGSTSGTPNLATLTGAVHTGLTASTEAIDLHVDLARNVQFATGAIANQRAVYFEAPTYAFVGASTISEAATVAISGPPIAGTNATLTQTGALWIEGGSLVLQPGAASANNLALTFDGDSDTGLYSSGAGQLDFVSNGTARFRILTTLAILSLDLRAGVDNNNDLGTPAISYANIYSYQFLSADGGLAGDPSFTFDGDTNTGMFSGAADTVGISVGGTEALRVDITATALDTALMIYDTDNATLERVTVGAADSGGAGFKVLRIPN